MKKEYFSLQIRRYKEEMFLLANSIVNNYHDAEDVVAETILTAYEKIHTLRDEEKFKSWLMQILVNNARKEIKKRNRYLFTDEIEKFLSQENEQTKKVWEFIFSLDEGSACYRCITLLSGISGKRNRQNAACSARDSKIQTVPGQE